MTRHHERRFEPNEMGGRLVWYRDKALAGYWDAHWQEQLSSDFYKQYEQGRLDDLGSVYLKYLPRSGTIVEAGCGRGQVVLGLRAHGFNVVGIDNAAGTVAEVNKQLPSLDIKVCDVTDIDCMDGAFSGYISLGVIEHRAEGPEPFIDEAVRVLADNGVAIFTVPRFSPFRRLKAWLGFYPLSGKLSEFYQYAFSTAEFLSFFRKRPLDVLYFGSTSGIKGLRDEVPMFRRWYDRSERGYRHAIVIRLFRWLPVLEFFFGHMHVIVCRRRPR